MSDSKITEGITQRLEAILAADAAGYSRLMGEDERATVATLNAYRAVFRERVEAHHGRVVDTAGDSVLAVFTTAIGADEAKPYVKRIREIDPGFEAKAREHWHKRFRYQPEYLERLLEGLRKGGLKVPVE